MLGKAVSSALEPLQLENFDGYLQTVVGTQQQIRRLCCQQVTQQYILMTLFPASVPQT